MWTEKVRSKSLQPQVPAPALVRVRSSRLALAFLDHRAPHPQSLSCWSGDGGFLGRSSSSWILWASSSGRIFSKPLSISSGRSSVNCSFLLLRSKDTHASNSASALVLTDSKQNGNVYRTLPALPWQLTSKHWSLHSEYTHFSLLPCCPPMISTSPKWTLSCSSPKGWMRAKAYSSNWAVVLPFGLGGRESRHYVFALTRACPNS